MTKVINTPNGEMVVSSLARRVVAGLTDIFILVAAAGIVGILAQITLSYAFGYWSQFVPLVVLCISVGIYLIVPRIYRLRTPGQWALGLHRFRYTELKNYTGEGNIWCIENCPSKEYTRRTIIVVSFLACFYVIAWLYNESVAV